jgi:hypothetical protein
MEMPSASSTSALRVPPADLSTHNRASPPLAVWGAIRVDKVVLVFHLHGAMVSGSRRNHLKRSSDRVQLRPITSCAIRPGSHRIRHKAHTVRTCSVVEACHLERSATLLERGAQLSTSTYGLPLSGPWQDLSKIPHYSTVEADSCAAAADVNASVPTTLPATAKAPVFKSSRREKGIRLSCNLHSAPS